MRDHTHGSNRDWRLMHRYCLHNFTCEDGVRCVMRRDEAKLYLCDSGGFWALSASRASSPSLSLDTFMTGMVRNTRCRGWTSPSGTLGRGELTQMTMASDLRLGTSGMTFRFECWWLLVLYVIREYLPGWCSKKRGGNVWRRLGGQGHWENVQVKICIKKLYSK